MGIQTEIDKTRRRTIINRRRYFLVIEMVPAICSDI
jgi:hypothetical protein